MPIRTNPLPGQSVCEYPPGFGEFFSRFLHENTIWVTDENAAEETASADEAVLSHIGMKVLGTLEGSRKILCFSSNLLKQFTIEDVQRYRLAHLIQDCGNIVFDYVYEGTPVENHTNMNIVRQAISAASSTLTISDSDRMGAGVWKHEGKLYLVGHHELAIYNGGFEKSTDPKAGEKVIDFGGCPQWYNYDQLCQYISDAHSVEWQLGVYNELCALFRMWDNWENDLDPEVIAALAIVTWVQTAWKFRPLVFVTGPTNSGKSCLLHDWFKAFYGSLSLAIDKPTEAGFRQFIENSARICSIDELEQMGGEERDKLQKTLRTSSRGGQIAKGTSSQKGMLFGLQHIPWCGAIETGLRDAADLNRYIVLSLKEVEDHPGRQPFRLPSGEEMADLGQRALAVAIVTQQRVAELAEFTSTARTVAKVNRRIQESYALPCALIAAVTGQNESEAAGTLDAILDSRNVVVQDVKDEEALMSEIMQATVRMRGGNEETVSKLIDPKSTEPDGLKALGTHGIALTGTYGGSGRKLFLICDIVTRKLLRGTRFGSLNIREILVRIPGAKVVQRKLGAIRPRGVSIPLMMAIEFGSARSDIELEADDDLGDH